MLHAHSSSLHLFLLRRHYAVNCFYPGLSVITNLFKGFEIFLLVSERLLLEYLEISLRIRLSHVVFGLPTDLYNVFTKAFSDLLAGVSESN